MCRGIIILFLVIIESLISITCFSQQTVKTDRYRAVQWGIEEGLPWTIGNLLIKDAKGFLWIGNWFGGLCRFDGSDFIKFIPAPHKPGVINADAILAFVEDSLKNIWIGTSEGLSRYDIKADTFTNFSYANSPVNSRQKVIPFWATNNDVYCLESGIGISAYNIHSLKKRKLLPLTDKIIDSIPGANYIILDTPSDCIWMLENYSRDPDKGGLLSISLKNGEKKRYTWPCYNINAKHRHSAEAMQFDVKRNSIWINTGDGLLEFSLTTEQFHPIDALSELLRSKKYEREVGVDIDTTGKVWFSTRSNGILIYDPKSNSLQQLSSDPALQQKIGGSSHHIYCDRDGIGWTTCWGGAGGIFELLPFNPPVKRYAPNPKVSDSLSNGFIYSIIPADNDRIWIGTEDGLNIFDSKTEKFEVLREKELPGISGPVIIPLRIDTIDQKAWLSAGTKNRIFNMPIYEMDMRTRKCSSVVLRNGSSQVDDFTVIPIFITPYQKGLAIPADYEGLFELKPESPFADLLIPFKELEVGRLVIVGDSLMFFQGGNRLQNFTFENKNRKWLKTPYLIDSLNWTYMVYNIKDETYWVSLRYALIHYDKNFREINTYTEKDGYKGAIFNMQIDNKGNLWFINVVKQIGRVNTANGIITTLSESDGYKSQVFDWFDAGAKDAQGNIYFGGNNQTAEKEGLSVIYPERYLSGITSAVYLRSLLINKKPYSLPTGINNLEELSFTYNQNNISIETGIIDHYAKGKGHFRYKLEKNNQEADWQYGAAYNTIRYENLTSGSYKLVMQASNVNNEFNSPERILSIYISPPFWETWWFRTLAALFLLTAFYGIYRWRTATLRKQKRILEQTVKERTAEVVEEKAEVEKQKAKSDELLLNILPFEVAEELKEKGYTTAKSFDEVTILFSDIKGFTHVAEKLSAQELVKEIDTYFSAFDNIMQRYGLEKIKTIGDAYIAAGGLPEDNTATVQNVVEAAIAMQLVVENFKKKRLENNLPYFELRIGIHTGPVVAGVVGIKKFQYDIWGDTVNLAARMEQSGVPGKINISQYTYEKVKDQFHCEHRGKIAAKNKGEIDMYFIIS